jgi:AcrR family transcriptional regulator
MTGARTRRERQREANRSRLLRAARRVMVRDGYERATIAEIAALADLGFGTFYSHFASKEAIFEALMEQAREARAAMMQPLLAGISDPAERIAYGAAFVVAISEREREFTRFLLEARRRAENPGDDAATQRVTALVAEGCATGRIRTSSPRALALAVSGVVVHLLWSRIRDELDADTAVRAAADLTLRLLGSEPAEAEEAGRKALDRARAGLAALDAPED